MTSTEKCAILIPNSPKGVIFVDFYGMQKLTLLDFPGRVACTLFTGGCNLRCPFCHNSGLISGLSAPEFSEETVLSFLSSRKGILDGVCVTGGEPLLHPGLGEFFAKVKGLGYDIKLDTNGCFPGALRKLLDAGLVDYVAMDVKNSPERYGETVGIPGFDLSPVRESVGLLMEGSVSYEFRTTVVRQLHTPADVEEIARWIAGARRYALQGFVDSGAVLSEGLSAWDKETMEMMAQRARQWVSETELRGI